MAKATDPKRTPESVDETSTRTNAAIKRYALIAIPLFVAVAIFVFLFLPKIRVSLWINGLHSDEPEIRREMMDKITAAAKDDPSVIDHLAEAIGDGDRGFNVRQAVVGILIRLNRTPKVIAAYERGSLSTRGVILARMQREKEFTGYWADNPELAVPETVRKWLAVKGDFTRAHAIQIALQLRLTDTMPLIRPLLVRSTASTVHEDKKQNLLIAASAAANAFHDCESIPGLIQLASADPNHLVRLRALQNTYAIAFGTGPCKGELEVVKMQALVRSALDDEAKEVRMAAMLVLEKEPTWAASVSTRLVEILDGEIPAGSDGTERRHALHALLSVSSAEFVDKLPQYFLDPNQHIRSSCANKSILFHKTPTRMESCLIGLVRNEVESDTVFRAALSALRMAAGKWHGLPLKLQTKARKQRPLFHADLNTMFHGGTVEAVTRKTVKGVTRETVEAVTRDSMAEAWFTWLALDLGLDRARLPSMIEAWKGFWVAADQDDATSARAALAKLPSAPAGLFTLENAWLQVYEK